MPNYEIVKFIALSMVSWIYFTWPPREQAVYKQASRGPMALSPFQGTKQ